MFSNLIYGYYYNIILSMYSKIYKILILCFLCDFYIVKSMFYTKDQSLINIHIVKLMSFTNVKCFM